MTPTNQQILPLYELGTILDMEPTVINHTGQEYLFKWSSGFPSGANVFQSRSVTRPEEEAALQTDGRNHSSCSRVTKRL